MKITIHPLANLPTNLSGVSADEAMILRLEANFRLLSERGVELADRFYVRLFAEHPELRSMFPPEMKLQKRKLMDTLGLIFEHLRSPGATRARLEKLGRAHIEYGTRPEHYPIVTQTLVAAMAELAGEEWSQELQDDWTSAMRLVGDIMLSASKA